MEELLRRVTRLEERLAQLVPAEVEASESAAYTPTYTGGTTAGTTTYARQLGAYVRVGRKVTAWVDLSWTNATGTGNGRVSLPFAAASDLLIYSGSLRLTGTSWTGADPEIVMGGGNSYFELQGVSSNAAPTVAPVEAAAAIAATVVYLTDG